MPRILEIVGSVNSVRNSETPYLQQHLSALGAQVPGYIMMAAVVRAHQRSRRCSPQTLMQAAAAVRANNATPAGNYEPDEIDLTAGTRKSFH